MESEGLRVHEKICCINNDLLVSVPEVRKVEAEVARVPGLLLTRSGSTSRRPDKRRSTSILR